MNCDKPKLRPLPVIKAPAFSVGRFYCTGCGKKSNDPRDLCHPAIFKS